MMVSKEIQKNLFCAFPPTNRTLQKNKASKVKTVDDICDREQHMTFKTQEIKAWDMREKGNSVGLDALP